MLSVGIRDIVIAHDRRGEFDEARQLAQIVPTALERAERYEGVAFYQAKAGQIEAALAWARVLPTPLERALAMFGVGLGSLQSLPNATAR
jgi:hypothetical protein